MIKHSKVQMYMWVLLLKHVFATYLRNAALMWWNSYQGWFGFISWFSLLTLLAPALERFKILQFPKRISKVSTAYCSYCFIMPLGTVGIDILCWLDILLSVICESVNTVLASCFPCNFSWGKWNTCVFDIDWNVCGKVENQI